MYRMSQLAIVNAPSSFTAIWAAMKPWLAKETIAKVSVLGANYRDALLQLVEAEDLPKSLGGTCTCSDCGAAGDSGKDEAAVEAKGEAAEMGRCVYSSAGPWLVGRKERREAWLRGERKAITLQPGELEMFLNKANEKGDEKDAKDAGENLDGSVDNNAEPPKDQATERHNEDSSDGSSPGPATPSVDAVQQQLDQVVIKDAPIDESVDPANEKYSESRLIQTGDLHAV
ncbi:hypothetical protein EW026_g1160 [Hermanssonia centrifuga]|uniref:CRAL-TRIO domain-containing protein n=1 Tax=Hermanssonia centrifuga TaxID=98765 RepID=A0A4S4KSD8_9APHY|nr:hypothetical protein EW026_g1160 [Hermanssonia centrifuga]